MSEEKKIYTEKERREVILDLAGSYHPGHAATCSASVPATVRNLLHYEICAAWWPQFVSWGPLQNIIAGHFARKVERKYRRWGWCIERQKRIASKEASK